jgi:hypothetical protein
MQHTVTFDSSESISEELRAAVFLHVRIQDGAFKRGWVKGMLSPSGAKKFEELNGGLRRMRSVMVAHNASHSALKRRYSLEESVRSTLKLRGATVLASQLKMIKRREGILALQLSIDQPELPRSVETLRLLGRRDVAQFLDPMGLEIASNPQPVALTIRQCESDSPNEPQFNASSNTIRLESRTFKDHFLPFHMQTVELGLLLSTQVALLRNAERDLQKRMWPWNSLTKTRKQLWEWCIQEPPSNKYGKLVYEMVWNDLDLHNRTRKILDALESRATAFSNIYLIALTLLSAATAAVALYNSL